MWDDERRVDPMIRPGIGRDEDPMAYEFEDDDEPLRRPRRWVAVVGIGIVVVWVASLVVQ